jgi:hypothetical protein
MKSNEKERGGFCFYFIEIRDIISFHESIELINADAGIAERTKIRTNSFAPFPTATQPAISYIIRELFFILKLHCCVITHLKYQRE